MNLQNSLLLILYKIFGYAKGYFLYPSIEVKTPFSIRGPMTKFSLITVVV